MRVLVSRLSALGDVVCTLPVAHTLKAGKEPCEVVWVCDRRFSAIPKLCGSIDQVVEVSKDVREVWRKVRALGRFDYALDVQGLLKSAAVVAFAQAKHRLGYHWQREGSSLFSKAVAPDPSSHHVVDQYVDVARAAGGYADRAVFDLAPDSGDVANVREKLDSAGRRARTPLVLVNAGAGWATKRWDPAKFAQVAESCTRAGCDVAFLGAPGDRPIFEEVRARTSTPVLDMVGKTNIAELVALVSLADVHLGGDTGSTHIAAALGVKAVGIYLVTDPVRSCPYGQIQRCFAGNPEADEVVRMVQTCLELEPCPSQL
ncbi:MAG: glycosyltransferase family 9 protein [Fimbriimonadaceae bacterium]|nr:glycosyltransferase family 9 protein [Fimbriimonadaceae bacterium]QYK56046.1 MAG: glycosyltransferase family 9 protein [Fimbriimonadaceae bacterium]